MALVRQIGRAVDRAAVRMLVALVRLYQLTLSPWLGRSCRFYPTCSHYMIESLRTHGSLRGTALGLWRLLRCHPFAKGGYDPVPPRRGRR